MRRPLPFPLSLNNSAHHHCHKPPSPTVHHHRRTHHLRPPTSSKPESTTTGPPTSSPPKPPRRPPPWNSHHLTVGLHRNPSHNTAEATFFFLNRQPPLMLRNPFENPEDHRQVHRIVS
ncbi:hypothetical protein PIB30_106173, partial [Stylosanthes scabra]|nr:hypothetical protein [Stylosanthes scabra]